MCGAGVSDLAESGFTSALVDAVEEVDREDSIVREGFAFSRPVDLVVVFLPVFFLVFSSHSRFHISSRSNTLFQVEQTSEHEYKSFVLEKKKNISSSCSSGIEAENALPAPLKLVEKLGEERFIDWEEV